MNGKLKKNIGFSLMPLAFLFLFEPGYTVLDPLPDFFGYAILCLAMINLADISPRIMDAFVGFRKGILISGLRAFSIYLLQTVFSGNHRTVGLLLFAFVFSFFELVVMIPAYKSFFEGLLSLGMMHDGKAVYEKKRKLISRINRKTGERVEWIRESRKNRTEKIFSLTVAFLLVKHCAMVLPEFTTLSGNTSYEFVSLLRVFGLVIALPISVAWLIRVCLYCAAVRKDTQFIDNLSALYLGRVNENPEFFTVREITVGIDVLLTSLILTVDFYSDYVNLIPDVLSYAVLIVAAILLRRYSQKWKLLSVVSACGIVTSFLSHYSAVHFHAEFYPNAIRKNLEAYHAYYRMLSYHILDAIIFCTVAVLSLLMLWDVYKCYTVLTLPDIEKEKREYRRKFILGGTFTLFFAIAAAVGTVYYILAQPFYYTGHWYFYYSTMISVAIDLIFVFAISYFIGFVKGAVRFRFRRYL